MKKIRLNNKELNLLVRFTDPFIHTPEKEDEILSYYKAGKLRPPSLIKYDNQYLIFNGNHRVLVAITHKLSLSCIILENLDDILFAQNLEGGLYRDISEIKPLSFENVMKDLIKSAKTYGDQDPLKYSY